MKFTGERYVPSEKGRIFLEHYHRYASIVNVIKGKDVIDIASGEGYGTSILAEFANSVIGVDISAEAIDHANNKYQRENLSFIKGSAIGLTFPDNSFDVVVSFETIEHLLQQDEVIAEFSRVLRTDGVLIISSPNRPIYQEECSALNEFHAKELDFLELDNLVKKKFKYVEYCGQRLQIGSIISPISSPLELSKYHGFIEDNESIKPGIVSIESPVYFIAFCSNVEISQDHLMPSVFYPKKIDLLREYMQYALWAKQVDSDIADRKYEIEILKKENDALTKENLLLRKALPTNERR